MSESDQSTPTRRRMLALCGATSACATVPAPHPLEGRTIYSESVMLSGADPEGRFFAAVRACTYPEARVAWLWCMLLTPDGFYQFASNDIAWLGGRVVDSAIVDASYLVDARHARARFRRQGNHLAADGATLAAAFDSAPHLGDRENRVEPGHVTIDATFEPHSGFAGLLPGRSELFGRAAFRCRVDDRDISFEGPAQFHEQAQAEPRFTTPFIFSSLWSADEFATALQTPQGSGGYLIEQGAVRAMRDLSISSRPDLLRLDFTTDAQARRIDLTAVRVYRVPIYGEDWIGRFVRGRHADRTMVGFLNSWR